MLGIVVIVLLGYFLYHYRPRNLETKFKQSLLWSELAKGCFVCHLIFLLIIASSSVIFLFFSGNIDSVFWTQNNNILLFPFEDFFENLDLQGIMIITFMLVLPVISAWLTQKKIIEPLRKEKVPRQNLFHLMGLFSIMPFLGHLSIIYAGYFIGGVISIFGNEILVQTFMNALPIFSFLFIGIGAVEISRFKLNHSLSLMVGN
jgi:hypothetical protein